MEEYELLSLMGDGGQGQVYRARHRVTGEHVAVKIMRCRDQRQANLALKEVKVLIQLRHEHIVAYTDFLLHFDQFGPLTMGAAPAAPSGPAMLQQRPVQSPVGVPPALVSVCLVMALCTEGTVADKVNESKPPFMQTGEHPVDETRIVKWLRQCASALQFVHERGFLHRDLKPANIFFHQDDVRLGDFGVATTAREFGQTSHVGTPYYFAPELLLRQPYDSKVDVWGLGLSFLELCTLRERAVNTQVIESPAAVDTVVDDLADMGFSARVGTLIRDMLQRQPSQRPTPAQILARLSPGLPPQPLSSAIQNHSGPLAPVVTTPPSGCLDGATQHAVQPPRTSPVNITSNCDMCDVYHAVVVCAECNHENYCSACDEVKHRNSQRRHHLRTPLSPPRSSDQLPVKPAAPMPVKAPRPPTTDPQQERRARSGSAEPRPPLTSSGAAALLPVSARAAAPVPLAELEAQSSFVPASLRSGILPSPSYPPLRTGPLPKENQPPDVWRPQPRPGNGAMEVADPPSVGASRGTSPVQQFPAFPNGQQQQGALLPPIGASQAQPATLYVPSKLHPTLSSAVAAARPGSMIMIAAGGSHPDPVELNVPNVTLQGEGEGDQRPRLGNGHLVTVLITAPGCKLSNVVVRQAVPRSQPTDRPFGVLVSIATQHAAIAGPVVIERCDVSSCGNAVGAQGEHTDVIVQKSDLHHAQQAGVYVHTNARCTVAACTISHCDYAGVLAKKASVRVVHCTISNCAQTGVFCHDSTGLVEGTVISDNGGCGIVLKAGASPVIRRNKIVNSGQAGVFCCERCTGTISENTITGSSKAGVIIKTEAHPTVTKNVISGGKETGIYVFENGQGHLEENDIHHNGNAGVLVTTGGDPRVVANNIHQNQFEGVWVCKQGGGFFEGNDLRRNVKGAKDIQASLELVRWQVNREDA
jgi:parallel beta-helix repeat protein